MIQWIYSERLLLLRGISGTATVPSPPAPKKTDKGQSPKGAAPGPFGNRSPHAPRTSNAPY